MYCSQIKSLIKYLWNEKQTCSAFVVPASPNGKWLYFNQPHVRAVVVLSSLNSSLKWDPSENGALLFIFLQTYMAVRNSTQMSSVLQHWGPLQRRRDLPAPDEDVQTAGEASNAGLLRAVLAAKREQSSSAVRHWDVLAVQKTASKGKVPLSHQSGVESCKWGWQVSPECWAQCP